MSEKTINRRLAKLEEKLHALEFEVGTLRENQVAGIAPRAATDNGTNTAQQPSPFAPEVRSAPNNFLQSKRPWYQTLSGWKTTLELAAIPFAIGYAIVTFCQWKDLKRNFVSDERPWLKVVSLGEIQWKEGQPILYPVEVSNVGKTPAKGIVATWQFLEYQKQDAIQFPFEPNAPKMRFLTGVLFPSDSTPPLNLGLLDRQQAKSMNFLATTLTAPFQDSINKGNSYLLLRITVEYKDSFGKDHWTHFCTNPLYKITAGGAPEVCSNFNDADKND